MMPPTQVTGRQHISLQVRSSRPSIPFKMGSPVTTTLLFILIKGVVMWGIGYETQAFSILKQLIFFILEIYLNLLDVVLIFNHSGLAPVF